MEGPDSITGWLYQLADGDDTAARQLWERFSARMQAIAQRKLQSFAQNAFDEEDVALSAFNAFCQAAQAGNCGEMADRDDLWRFLAVVTERKARQRIKEETRHKRGGGARHLADVDWEVVPGTEPPPQLAVLLTDQCHQFLGKLPNDALRNVAILKLQGFSNNEVAERLQYSRPTVQRMLTIIRRTWGSIA